MRSTITPTVAKATWVSLDRGQDGSKAQSAGLERLCLRPYGLRHGLTTCVGRTACHRQISDRSTGDQLSRRLFRHSAIPLSDLAGKTFGSFRSVRQSSTHSLAATRRLRFGLDSE